MNLKRMNEALANGATISSAADSGVCWKGNSKQSSNTESTTENFNLADNDGVTIGGSESVNIEIDSTDFEIVDRVLDHTETSNLNTNNTLALALGWSKDILSGAGEIVEGNTSAFETVAGSVTGLADQNTNTDKRAIVYAGGALIAGGVMLTLLKGKK